MNKPKTKYIILIIIVLVLTGLFIYLKIKQNQKTTQPKIVPIYSIKSDYTGKYPISITFQKENVPSLSLPSLTITKKSLSNDYAYKIATNIGFTGEPSSFKDINYGQLLFWKNDDSSFFIYPSSGKISYYQNVLKKTTNKQLSDTEIVSTATNFLINNQFFTDGEIEKYSLNYLAENPNNEGLKISSKENAIVYQVDFFFKNAGYPILTKGTDTPLVSVKVNLDGSINAIDIFKVGNIQPGLTMYKLKSYEEIKSAISESVLIVLSGYQFVLNDLPNTSVKEIQISRIKPAYLMESVSSTTLLPIYVLGGTAIVEGYTEPLDAILYLPAISSN